jgi:hypothetical protein
MPSSRGRRIASETVAREKPKSHIPSVFLTAPVLANSTPLATEAG